MEDHSETIKNEAFTLISESLGVPLEAISADKKIADLSEDSIRLFELLLAFERKYQIKTAYEDVIRLETVGDILEYLHTQLEPAKSA